MSSGNRGVKFEEMWTKLLEGIERVYSFHQMPPADWMQLYT